MAERNANMKAPLAPLLKRTGAFCGKNLNRSKINVDSGLSES
jgi:hypothetical protein